MGLNYSAYSNRIINWANPDALIYARDEVNNLLASATSISVYASEEAILENKEDLDTVTSKILDSDPSIIYSRSYKPQELVAGIEDQ